jgi:hypothetical protein
MLAFLAVALGAPGSGNAPLPADLDRVSTRYQLVEVTAGGGVAVGSNAPGAWAVGQLDTALRWFPQLGAGLHASVSPHLLAVAPMVRVSPSDRSGVPDLGVGVGLGVASRETGCQVASDCAWAGARRDSWANAGIPAAFVRGSVGVPIVAGALVVRPSIDATTWIAGRVGNDWQASAGVQIGWRRSRDAMRPTEAKRFLREARPDELALLLDQPAVADEAWHTVLERYRDPDWFGPDHLALEALLVAEMEVGRFSPGAAADAYALYGTDVTVLEPVFGHSALACTRARAAANRIGERTGDTAAVEALFDRVESVTCSLGRARARLRK